MILRIDIDKSADVALRLERDLGGGPFHTMDWRELNHNLFTALEMQKVMLSLVIATIIFVAAFNVVAYFVFHLKVAATVGKGTIDPNIVDHYVIFGALVGAIGSPNAV